MAGLEPICPFMPKYQFWISSYIMGLNCSTHMGLSYATSIRHVLLHIMAPHDWSEYRTFWAFYQFYSNLINKPLQKKKSEFMFKWLTIEQFLVFVEPVQLLMWPHEGDLFLCSVQYLAKINCFFYRSSVGQIIPIEFCSHFILFFKMILLQKYGNFFC